MESSKALINYEIYSRKIDRREPNFVDLPPDLHADIKDYLQSVGISKLYSHQAEMFELAQNNNNVIITTSTASGKTWSFLLPVLQEIFSNPLTRAIFVYPTKALTHDQFRTLEPILECFGAGKISAGIYDGDTPPDERIRIRGSANIILTNPEMLNSAFLPNHSQNGFNLVFSNLKCVVVDELHYYRGAFGSHLANIFKRMKRICKYYNSSPQFFCSSATIANPLELAEKMFGCKFEIVDRDGSASPNKTYHFIQPPTIKVNGNLCRRSVASVASELLPDLTIRKHNFIAFCKSRKAVEVLLKETKDRLDDNDRMGISLSDLIEGYRGGYKPLERKEIESKMANGQIRGLVSTNALELGIDIGKVDTTVLVGYPGTKASFWQQTGRAGRGNSECDNYIILDNLPFDQFIAGNPEWLFETQSENAVIDPNNLFIQLAHVRSAAAELPLTLNDMSIFPDLGEIIPVLLSAEELRMSNGKYMWCGKEYPAGDYSLRNMDNERYQLINKSDNSVITEMDETQAFREIHKGAIYLHNGQSFIVSNLDLELKRAIVEPINDDYYTDPQETIDLHVIKAQQKNNIGRSFSLFGDIKVNSAIRGYKKIQFHSHQNLGYQQLDTPLTKSFDTEGAWIVIPSEVVSVFISILERQKREHPGLYWKTYFDGLCYAILNSALMITMTTKNELASYFLQYEEGGENNFAVCIYDLFVGGLGYSEKAYELFDTIIHNAIKMIEGCGCEDGCASCVGDHLDKNIVLWGLKSFYEQTEAPISTKPVKETTTTVLEKPYKFERIEEQWIDFVDFYSRTGETFADFISEVQSVSTDGNKLVLNVRNRFCCLWIMEETNKTKLRNVISEYFDIPVGFEIICTSKGSDTTETESKLLKRYRDLTE